MTVTKFEPKVGDGISAGNASWTFGEDTAKGFTSHVRRSVPLYDEGHDLVCKLSDFFVRDGSVAYELGTSTAVLLKRLADRHKKRRVTWVGIDREPNMIEQAKVELGESYENVSLVVDDINTFPYEKSDFVVAYHTIMFVPPHLRQQLFNRIYETLNWGGALVLFEKVRGPDARFQDILTALYTDFKIEHGFTSEEIVAKTRSLKGIQEPFSTQGNIDLMRRAGFQDIMTIMKMICFEGFLAIK